MYAVPFETFPSGTSKAARLALLYQKGLPIPRGFVVTREARLVSLSEMGEAVLSEIKHQYENMSIDSDMKDVSGQALDMIRTGRDQIPVAVRGDGSSRLFVTGMGRLKEAIQELWQSGSDEIVVQKMLNAEKTGAVFPHPVTEDVLVESAWGIAMPGGINPDLYQTGHAPVIGKKEWEIRRDNYSNTSVRSPVPVERQETSSLGQEELQSIMDLHGQVAEHFSPARMEFSFQRGKPWILQAEPVERVSVTAPPQDGEFCTRGEIISPGSIQGTVRVIKEPADLERVEVGDILTAEHIKPEYLQPGLGGILTTTCSLHLLGSALKVPALRIPDLDVVQEGERVLLDAVRGEVHRLASVDMIPPVEESRQPSPAQDIQEPVPAREQGTRPLRVALSSAREEPPMAAGYVVRAESILTSGGRHPAAQVLEAPEQVTQTLVEELEPLARRVFPKPVWYMAFDGRTDELQSLEGAEEPEKNPLLGWHGTRRAVEDPVFRCELAALRELYNRGLHNVLLLLPFVSQPEELERVRERVDFPLKIGLSVETPAAALEIEAFCKQGLFAVQVDLDMLTQLTLGVDVDNPRNARHFTRLNPAVRTLVEQVVETCRQYKIEVSLRGEACNAGDLPEGAGITTDADNLTRFTQ